MFQNKLFRALSFTSIVGLLMGLYLNSSLQFTNNILNTTIAIVGGTIILHSLRSKVPICSFVMAAISTTFLIIAADYYTNYIIGIYPITLYLTTVTLLIGIFLLMGQKVVEKTGSLLIGIALFSIPLSPTLRYLFEETLYPHYYWAWLIFPVSVAFFATVLLAKQRFLQKTVVA